MSKHKFKIGDRVRINRRATDDFVPDRFLGPKGEIIGENPLGSFFVKVSDRRAPLLVSETSIDFINPEKIIIYRNGAKTVAKNTVTGKTGVAKCSPEDEFDFSVGAKLAFERLTNPEPEKPKYYNGKVVCVHTVNGVFTKGKIYEVVDGRLFSNDDFTYSRFSSVEGINKALAYKFIELVE